MQYDFKHDLFCTYDVLLLFQTNIEICFVNVFDSFILVIILNTFKFKSFVLFRTHILSRISSRVLQLLSKLTLNG